MKEYSIKKFFNVSIVKFVSLYENIFSFFSLKSVKLRNIFAIFENNSFL